MAIKTTESIILNDRASIEFDYGTGTLSLKIDGVTVFSAATGIATFASMFKIPVNADVAAAGSTQSDAAALSTGLTVVTGANGTKGVKLPATTGGDLVFIKGTAAAVLKVWPDSGAQINAVGADTAMSLASGAIPVILVSKSATQWYTFPLVPS